MVKINIMRKIPFRGENTFRQIIFLDMRVPPIYLLIVVYVYTFKLERLYFGIHFESLSRKNYGNNNF